MNKLILIIGAFLLCQKASALSETQYIEISQISNYISKTCPPNACVIIGIGRSPTLIIAKLQLDFDNYAWNIPLSDFKYSVAYPELNPTEEFKLFQHFDTFLPTLETFAGKTIWIVDYAIAGDSLIASQYYLKRYLDNRIRDNDVIPPVHGLAIAKDISVTSHELHPKLNHILSFPFEHAKSDSFIKALEQQKFDTLAQYGSFKLTDPSMRKVENPSYTQLKSEMQQMFKSVQTTNEVSFIEVFPENSLDLDILQISDQKAEDIAPQIKWFPSEKQKQFYARFFSKRSIRKELAGTLAYVEDFEAAMAYFKEILKDPDPRITAPVAASLEELATNSRLEKRFIAMMEFTLDAPSGISLATNIRKDSVSALMYYSGTEIVKLFKLALANSDEPTRNVAKKVLLNWVEYWKKRKPEFVSALVRGLKSSEVAARISDLILGD